MQGFIGLQLAALQQQGQGLGHAQQAQASLGAAGSGQQPDAYFRQTDDHAAHVGGNASVAGQGDLETTAQCRAVERRDNRLAGGFHAAQEAGEAPALVEQSLGILLGGERCFQRLEVGTGDKRALGRGQDDAHDRRIGNGTFEGGTETVDEIAIHHVGAGIWLVDRQGADAIGIDGILEVINHFPESCFKRAR
ncbi:hypothetical protein D3C86_1483280 [compost metagenome]